MRDFGFLFKVIAERILLAIILVLVIFNPWASLSQLILPDNFQFYDLETGWPYKLLAVVVAFGLIFMFIKTTTGSMGRWGVTIMLVVLTIIAYIPFYAEYLRPTYKSVGYVAYFFMLPVLLGIGLSTGYITRWLNGTLITKPISDHGQHVSHQTTDSPTDVHHG